MVSNFDFLKEHDPLFFQLAHNAETAFTYDPNTTLIKLRQLAELLAKQMAVSSHIFYDQQIKQIDLLDDLGRASIIPPLILQLFHALRKEGNKATHQYTTSHKIALDALQVARVIAIWFHQSFGKNTKNFKPAEFITPTDPTNQLQQLQTQIAQLRNNLIKTHQTLEENKQLNSLLTREKQEAEKIVSQSHDNIVQVKKEFDFEKASYELRLKELEVKLSQQSDVQQKQYKQQLIQQTSYANDSIRINEDVTRVLIDQQLRDAGWTVDTKLITYKNGARPEKNVNKAIAEWPTCYKEENGRADYVLFCGLVPVAIVEAKKSNLNVAGKITQAERYSKGFEIEEAFEPAWDMDGNQKAWCSEKETYYVPFVYSCNGREFFKQQAEQSGIWFRDVRSGSNLKRPLMSFHSPNGLFDILKRSKEKAEEILKKEGFSYLKLRDYQQKAIEKTESALAAGQRNCLIAMATGTGKTRTIIGLMYRFLKSERFKRILFLVDRRSLGQQALDFFNEAQLEQNQPLSKIYNIADLGDMVAEAETRIQVATVQAMVKRVFLSDNVIPVDEYDCIIVDEAHRGYTLDQEMTEGEVNTRNHVQYLSSYRRVLDYFDAVKIGLTATPAKHTTDIFGFPVYTYSYREAVADDWLIDHEPPIRYATLLSQKGIHFEKGDNIHFIDQQTGNVELAELEDEMDFNIESFNRRVINEDFNRVICTELVNELDLFSSEKTMIFCVTDRHADMVKRLLDEAFKNVYGEEYNQAAVAKITGQSDKVDQLIRLYKNEKYPKIAITVDLLTTGIDVAEICNLVFMRKVRSRILYEQMKGRATRRCDKIGKTVFRIFDPVDLYDTLQEVSTMKPLVKNPNITLEQLAQELTDTDRLQHAKNSAGDENDATYADTLLNQFNQKMMRVLRKATAKAENDSRVKEKLEELEEIWGVSPATLHQHLHKMGVDKASEFIKQHTQLIMQIEQVKALIGSEYNPIISEHKDELISRTQGMGKNQQPEDYIDGFNQFIKQQLNQSAALFVVVNKPKDLTRQQLKEIRLLLDEGGYSEVSLKTAWRNQTNQEIGATIIGFIRQAALGEALVSFSDRVNKAMQVIYGRHAWTVPQRKWLERLSKQIVNEVIIDKDRINAIPAFQGVKQLDKMLDNKLDSILDTIKENLWQAG